MTLEFDELLYAPVHEGFAVTALLTPGSCVDPVTIEAIDRTSGIAVSLSGDSEVQTILPAAAVRMTQITALGLIPDELDKGTLEFNGKIWTIDSHMLDPSPEGDLKGEVLLILSQGVNFDA